MYYTFITRHRPAREVVSVSDSCTVGPGLESRLGCEGLSFVFLNLNIS